MRLGGEAQGMPVAKVGPGPCRAVLRAKPACLWD